MVPSVKLIITPHFFPHPSSLLGFMDGTSMLLACFIRCIIFVSGSIWPQSTTKRMAKVKYGDACLWFVLFVLQVTLRYTEVTWQKCILDLAAPACNLRVQTCEKILIFFAFLMIWDLCYRKKWLWSYLWNWVMQLQAKMYGVTQLTFPNEYLVA